MKTPNKKLKKLYKNDNFRHDLGHLPDVDVATKYGITPQAVAVVRNYYGIEKYPDEDIASYKARHLYANDAGFREMLKNDPGTKVAKKYGIQVTDIFFLRKTYNLPAPGRMKKGSKKTRKERRYLKKTGLTRDTAKSLIDDGKSYTEIAKMYELTPSRVWALVTGYRSPAGPSRRAVSLYKENESLRHDLGLISDVEIAERYSISQYNARMLRKKYNIAAYNRNVGTNPKKTPR